MKVFTLAAVFTALACSTAWADGFTTSGNGTTWTLSKLAQTDGSGVTREGNVFTVASTVVVAANDHFEMEGGVTVLLGTKVSFEVEGSASMAPDARSLFTRADESAVPGMVFLKCENNITFVSHLDFEYTGLKYFAGRGLCVDDCTFRYHEASTANGMAALSLAGEGAVFSVTNSVFEKNKRAAIGGAANATNPITIEHCQFLCNDQQNLNYPQLNLTASENIIVRNNVVTGDRTKTRGGGIMVADMMGVATNPHTFIEANTVTDNRYGIALYSGQTALVRDNIVRDNNTETTPANGGSGINIYDASGTQNTVITGNLIEGNLWGVTVIGGANINLGKTDDPEAADYNPGLNIFYNNGNEGVVYDLYNNSANTVYAQGNYWKTAAAQTQEAIEDVIFHKHDNPALGEVIFMPFADDTTVGVYSVRHSASEGKQQAVFDLQGRQLSAAHKHRGLNIVKHDGTVRKLLTK